MGANVDGCRVAPYVNMPSMRMAFDRIHMQHFSHLDPMTLSPHPSAAAAAAAALPSMLFYPTPHYAVNLALAHNVTSVTASKNSSIADLRMKAKKHAATLGF